MGSPDIAEKPHGLYRRYFLLLAIVCAGVLAEVPFRRAAAQVQETLSISTAKRPPFSNDARNGFHDLLLETLFKRLDIPVTIAQLPFARSLINLKRGLDDMTIAPKAWENLGYDYLRQVPEPFLDVDIVAFARDDTIKISDWRSLQPYNIAFISGWKLQQVHNVTAKTITHVRGPDQMFTMLDYGRIDLGIFEKWQGFFHLKQKGLENIYMLSPPLKQSQLHIYVHERHEALVPRISNGLKALKRDGTYQEIFEQTLKVWEGS